MDRRSFLALLGAVGVLTGAPKWLIDPIMRNKLAPGLTLPDDDVSPWLAPTDLAVLGRPEAQTFELSATHTGAMGSAPAFVQLKRLSDEGGQVLLDFAIAPGGVLRWRAYPGEEIYGPVRIVVPELVQAQVIGTDARGRVVMASKDGIVPLALI